MNVKTFLYLLGIFLILIAYPVMYYNSVEEVTVTINLKERVNKNDDSYYLVFAENETFKNTDSFMFLKFNSSDLQGQLRLDSTYKLKVVGWRIKFLSKYRNILKIK